MIMKVCELEFKMIKRDEDKLYIAKGDFGRITVLDRITGWSNGVRDTETGYKDKDGKFWLVSGMFDIRDFVNLDVEDAIAKIKELANTCIGV
jgi:hypothetical protein